MLHVLPQNVSLTKHLCQKPINVLVTNRCNCQCGGCSQLCPSLPQSRQWDIPIDQLQFNIKVLKTTGRTIGIFGGEPMIHPNWDEIVNVLAQNQDIHFWVYTNGKIPNKVVPLKNVFYKIDFKPKGFSSVYRATMVAPQDCFISHNKDYWEIAQNCCNMWNGCWSLVYNNRAYLCEPAAAFDWLDLGQDNWQFSSGWSLKLGKDPFNKSYHEICNQARKFCSRCGYCGNVFQKANEPTIISDRNAIQGVRHFTRWKNSIVALPKIFK